MGHADLINNEELQTRRLSLRRPTRADVNAIHRIHRDPRAYAHNPGDALATRAEAATAVVDWASAHLPDHPIIARVRPDNAASLKVAARAGLRRAPHLDTDGEDGLDWIFTSNWPDDAEPIHEPRP
ncbi:GNAT family N-acetyltransferase [Micromonospora sp. C95]|uniref:GNAT family N-acetyltransferase n=1 Tax=Micromonospora sp. C95 TaxID=2824882 RepID=UPI001B373372|nr:GNAT family N-acetyltransferase [Micromonospora sp. C95]MBQ1026685.1 GNAT family N-acetyltransferase [Micromonospora sp. C95]